jgi:hypothetical protein
METVDWIFLSLGLLVWALAVAMAFVSLGSIR